MNILAPRVKQAQLLAVTKLSPVVRRVIDCLSAQISTQPRKAMKDTKGVPAPSSTAVAARNTELKAAKTLMVRWAKRIAKGQFSAEALRKEVESTTKGPNTSAASAAATNKKSQYEQLRRRMALKQRELSMARRRGHTAVHQQTVNVSGVKRRHATSVSTDNGRHVRVLPPRRRRVVPVVKPANSRLLQAAHSAGSTVVRGSDHCLTCFY